MGVCVASYMCNFLITDCWDRGITLSKTIINVVLISLVDVDLRISCIIIGVLVVDDFVVSMVVIVENLKVKTVVIIIIYIMTITMSVSIIMIIGVIIILWLLYSLILPCDCLWHQFP